MSKCNQDMSQEKDLLTSLLSAPMIFSILFLLKERGFSIDGHMTSHFSARAGKILPGTCTFAL